MGYKRELTKEELKQILCEALGLEYCEITAWHEGTVLNLTHMDVEGEERKE